MKAKLVKDALGYYLKDGDCVDGFKLSTKNCQAIERGYDLDELADEHANQFMDGKDHFYGFKAGFQKALELMGDKKFTEEDMIRASDWYVDTKGKKSIDELIESLQQTEWDVEIVIEPMNLDEIREQGKGFLNVNTNKPKLDATGCLILKKI